MPGWFVNNFRIFDDMSPCLICLYRFYIGFYKFYIGFISFILFLIAFYKVLYVDIVHCFMLYRFSGAGGYRWKSGAVGNRGGPGAGGGRADGIP